MNNANEPKRRIAKDPFLQVSEGFFDKEEIDELMIQHGYLGIGIYLRLLLKLLQNKGVMKYGSVNISTKKREKLIIDEIIKNPDLFYFNEDGTHFSSPLVDEQLIERGKFSQIQRDKANKGHQKKKSISTEQMTDEFIIAEDVESYSKPKLPRLTQEQMDEYNRQDGIKPKPRRKIDWGDDLELDA